MRLTGFYINGFGLFHDLKIDGLSPKLTVILGQNESGKSTLLGFLRAILFGFPDGRSNENPYPPLAGGQHGGNIIFLTEDQRLYVVERGPGPRGGKVSVHEVGQSRKGREALDPLLGTANKVLFNNIYAFSLSELQNFETLNTDAIRETLYSAGAGINSSRLLALRSFFEKKEGRLFKPGGNKPKINKLLSRLSAIQKEKKALFGSIDQYDHFQSQISRLKEEISSLEQQKIETAIHQKKTEQWINIWPDWIKLSLTKDKLKKTEIIDSFPSQAITRLEELKTRIEDLQDELRRKEEALSRQEAILSSLKTDPALMEQAASIRMLQKELGHFEAVGNELLSLKQEMTHLEQKLDDSLRRLGPHWSEKKALEFDLSISLREGIRDFRETMNKTNWEVRRKRDLFEIQFNRKEEAEESFKNLPAPSSEDPEGLSRKLNACKALLTLASKKRSLKDELRHIQARLNDFQEEKSLLDKPIRPGESQLPLWPIPLIVISGSFLLIWFGLKNSWDWALPAVGALILVIIIAWFFLTKVKKIRNERENEIQQGIDHLAYKMEKLEDEQSKIAFQIDEIDKKMAPALHTLSLDEVPSGGILEQMITELSNLIEALDKWMESRRRLEQAISLLDEAKKALEEAESETDEIQSGWLKWLKERDLDPNLSPEGALEALSLIETCREQINYINQIRAKIDTLEESKANYIRMVNNVLMACKRQRVRDEEVLVVVHHLIQEFLKSEQASQKRDLLGNEIKANHESMTRLKEHISELKKEMTSLIKSGGAEDEDLFRKRAETYEKRISLKEEIERAEGNIRRLLGIQGALDQVLDKLSTMDLEQLQKEKIRLERALNELDAILDLKKREQAKLEEQARQLVNDERISILRNEEEALKEELSLLAEEWSVIRFAEALIKLTRASYERERQPEVVREAARFFRRLTLGRYPSIVAPIDQNRIEVICQDNSRKEIAQLSRGTAEQLFLSLRFGFIREFSKSSEPLPIIMDEILVNFDPSRAKATVEAILELSREHQVLFFTCHPETARLFQETDPHLPVLEISNGGVIKWNAE